MVGRNDPSNSDDGGWVGVCASVCVCARVRACARACEIMTEKA